MKTVIDVLGKRFAPIKDGSIVSLVPSVTETLFDLGLGDRIVGVTRYCIYPEEAKTKQNVGGTKSPNVEKIRKLKPSIVIANKEENPKDRIEQIMEFSKVFVTFPISVEDSLKMIGDLSILLLGEIPDLVRQIHEEADILLKKKRNSKFKVFCPIWKDPWMTINVDTYIHDILQKCGFVNIFGNKGKRYPTISGHELESIHPDVVLLPDEPYRFTHSDIDLLREINPNLETARIEIIDGSLLSWYGTRTVKGLKFLHQMFEELSLSNGLE